MKTSNITPNPRAFDREVEFSLAWWLETFVGRPFYSYKGMKKASKTLGDFIRYLPSFLKLYSDSESPLADDQLLCLIRAFINKNGVDVYECG